MSLVQLPDHLASLSISANEGKGMEDRGPVEPLLVETPNRFVLFPIRYPLIWAHYKSLLHTFTPAESLSSPSSPLSSGQASAASSLLSWDNGNAGRERRSGGRWCERWGEEIKAAEARCFWGFAGMQENITLESLAVLSPPDLPTPPADKADFLHSQRGTFGERLLAYAVGRRTFEAGWWACMGGDVGAQGWKAVWRVSEFCIVLIQHLITQPSPETIMALIGQAVQIEVVSLPARDLSPYDVPTLTLLAQHQADSLLRSLNLPPLYGNAPNPLSDGTLPEPEIPTPGTSRASTPRIGQGNVSAVHTPTLSARANDGFTLDADF